MGSENKLIIIMAIILGIILAITLIVIRPSVVKISALSQQIKAEQKIFDDLDLKDKKLIEAKKDFKKVEENAQTLENVFWVEGKELDLITTFEDLALRNEINQSVELGDKQNFRDKYTTMPLHLVLRGTFSNLIKYFIDLEKMDFYVNVDLADVLSLPTSQGEISVSLTAKTYWRPE
jgi:hypothetical protein